MNKFLCLRFVEGDQQKEINAVVIKLGVCKPLPSVKANKKCTFIITSISSNGLKTMMFSSINCNEQWYFFKLKENTQKVCLHVIRKGNIIINEEIEI